MVECVLAKMHLCVSVLLASPSVGSVTPVHLCLSLLLINLNCNVPPQTRRGSASCVNVH